MADPMCKKTIAEVDSALDTSLARAALLAAVEDATHQTKDTTGTDETNGNTSVTCSIHSSHPIVSLFKANNKCQSLRPDISARDQRKILLDCVRNFSKPTARRFFAGLATVIATVRSDQYFLSNTAPHSSNNDLPVSSDSASSEKLLLMQYAALLVRTYIEALAKRKKSPSSTLHMDDEVFQVAQGLHDQLFALNSHRSHAVPALESIIAMCESWWSIGAGQKESLIVQSLPLLIVAATNERRASGTSSNEIKRLYRMRETLDAIDFSDASSKFMLNDVLRLVSSAACLGCLEGRKFIAYCFYVDDLRENIHQAIRAQIPNSKAAVLFSYSDIYFRAWKEAPQSSSHSNSPTSLSCRDQIENDALADLFFAAIHAASASLHQSIMATLDAFHKARMDGSTQSLLHRMYGPILWRGLCAANAMVRENAVRVLARVFPLEDPSITHRTKSVHQALSAIVQALQDRDYSVRLAASSATAQVLINFWDVIPSSDIQTLLNRKSIQRYILLHSNFFPFCVANNSSKYANNCIQHRHNR
jgi:hypothetical protein